MKRWKQLDCSGCTETLTDGKNFVMFEWGWATGEQLGCHNEFDTDTIAYLWAGDGSPMDKDSDVNNWEAIDGFNHVIVGIEPDDMTDMDCEKIYEEETGKILEQVSIGYY